jgi:hypothetical protein
LGPGIGGDHSVDYEEYLLVGWAAPVSGPDAPAWACADGGGGCPCDLAGDRPEGFVPGKAVLVPLVVLGERAPQLEADDELTLFDVLHGTWITRKIRGYAGVASCSVMITDLEAGVLLLSATASSATSGLASGK